MTVSQIAKTCLSMVLAYLITSCGNNIGPDPDPKIIYKEISYTELTRSEVITYGSDEQYNTLIVTEPVKNLDEMRPLILLSPGGGFVRYNQTTQIQDLANNLARRGYVVAVVKYTLNPELDNSSDEENSKVWFKATQDQKSAVRYFKNNAAKYRIDPDNVFIGGWSNGGTAALTAAFLNEDEIEIITNPKMKGLVEARTSELGFENTDNPGSDSKVKGALILNGYSFEVNFIDADDPALMMISHSGSHWSDGTIIVSTFSSGADTYYGLKPLVNQAKNVGFVEGENLESIIMKGYYSEPNFAPLSSDNYEKIATFFHQNLE